MSTKTCSFCLFLSMNFLRLFNNYKSPSEYYVKDRKAQYLSDIKKLNIIVGANNTRKSRFIRQVINTEFKVLIESEIDINSHFQEIENLFDGDDRLANGNFFIKFTFETPPTPTKQYNYIKSFFDKQSGIDNKLNLTDVKKIVEEIQNEISSVSLAENAVKFSETVESYKSLLNLIYQIYQQYAKSLSNYSYDTLNPTIVDGIKFNFPNIQYLDGYDDYEERVAFFAKILGWFSKIEEIKITPFHDANIIYIPVLRASRSLEGASTDTFTKTIVYTD